MLLARQRDADIEKKGGLINLDEIQRLGNCDDKDVKERKRLGGRSWALYTPGGGDKNRWYNYERIHRDG